MRVVLLSFGLAATLAACSFTPLELCVMDANRAIRDVDAMIVETSKNLERGYIYIPAEDDFGITYCMDDFGDMRLCLNPEEGQTVFKKLRIEPTAEQAKLEALIARRSELLRQRAQCEVTYAEPI